MMIKRLFFILITTTCAGLMVACKPTPSPIAIPATPQKIKKQIEDSKASLTLVHVWATWCDPCRKEFPDVLKIYRKYKGQGLAVELVSADTTDELENVNTFLREQHSPIGSLVSTDLGQDFIEMLSPKWSGALPASFFFDVNGKLVAEWEGKHTYHEYASTIQRLLKP